MYVQLSNSIPPPPSPPPAALVTQVSAHPAVIEHCHKLAELGWLYRRVSKFVEGKAQDTAQGLVVQVRNS